MVANPDICRANGRRSRGPVTERGKANASKNATKHGLLAERAPLLSTEDLESFQGILQGLITEYQPQTPTEHLLIQQVAMGWLRLHRLWNVEAAIANQTMLRIEKAAKYPQDAGFNELLESLEGNQNNPNVLKKERRCLQHLLVGTEDWVLMYLPKRHFSKWEQSSEAKKAVQVLHEDIEKIINKYPRESIPSDQDERLESVWGQIIGFSLQTDTKTPCYHSLKWTAEKMVNLCRNRIQEIDAALEDMNRLTQEIQRSEKASKGISDQAEKLTRYERHITKQLYDALDRLQAIQRQQQHEGSMGSFGSKG